MIKLFRFLTFLFMVVCLSKASDIQVDFCKIATYSCEQRSLEYGLSNWDYERVSAGIYKIHNDYYLLEISVEKREGVSSSVSQWIALQMLHRNPVKCLNPHYPHINFLLRSYYSFDYEKFKLKEYKVFEKLVLKKAVKSYDQIVYFVGGVKKPVGIESYGYLFYAVDKDFCYQKFVEIFGQDAIGKLKEVY